MAKLAQHVQTHVRLAPAVQYVKPVNQDMAYRVINAALALQDLT